MSISQWKARLASCRDEQEIQALLDEAERWVVDWYGPPTIPGRDESALNGYSIGLYRLSDLLDDGAELPEPLQPESGNRWMVMAVRQSDDDWDYMEPSCICPHPTAQGAAADFFEQLAPFEQLPPLYPERAIRLGSSLEEVRELWGEPDSVESELVEGGTDHHFRMARIGSARVTEWRGVVHGILYAWTVAFDENLAWVAQQHADAHTWEVVTDGYLYQRSDGNARLTCSAMPMIGVWTPELMSAWRT